MNNINSAFYFVTFTIVQGIHEIFKVYDFKLTVPNATNRDIVAYYHGKVNYQRQLYSRIPINTNRA